LILFTRSALFYTGARLGATLQPVGLTGGIACGKSSVSKLLREPSKAISKDAFAVIDVDAIAHDILVQGKMGVDCGYKRVVNAFSGDDIFVESNEEVHVPSIDRRKLGDVIFRDTGKRRALNRITHPLISRIMIKQIVREGFRPSNSDTSIVSVDIPLLYEVGLVMRLLFGIKVVVACNEDVQLHRLMERNKDLTKEQCQDRIKSQIPVTKKAQMADIVIWNNGTMDDLLLQVEDVRKEVLTRSHAFFGVTLAKLVFIAGLSTALSGLVNAAVLSDQPAFVTL
jgi:dephospho-CoA kinase